MGLHQSKFPYDQYRLISQKLIGSQQNAHPFFFFIYVKENNLKVIQKNSIGFLG